MYCRVISGDGSLFQHLTLRGQQINSPFEPAVDSLFAKVSVSGSGSGTILWHGGELGADSVSGVTT
jgi:hypothetical protein